MKKLEAQYAVPLLKKYSLPFIEMYVFSKKEELQKIAKKIKYPATLSLHTDAAEKESVLDCPSFSLAKEEDAHVSFDSLKILLKKKYAHIRNPLFFLQQQSAGDQMQVSLSHHSIFGPVLSFHMKEKQLATFLPLQEDFFRSFFSTFGCVHYKTQLIGFLSRLSKLSEDKNIKGYALTCAISSSLFVTEVVFDL